jgi:hypothetical protein
VKQEQVWFWYLPNPNPRGKPYRSRWKMSEAEAKARGALRRDDASVELLEIPESDEEVAARRKELYLGNETPPWWIKKD